MGASDLAVVQGTVAKVHMLDNLRIVYRRRWLAAGVFNLTLAAVGLYTFAATPMYEAQSQVLIESNTPNIVEFAEVLDEGEARANYYQTQYELLRSRALARRTVSSLAPWAQAYFSKRRPGGWSGNQSAAVRPDAVAAGGSQQEAAGSLTAEGITGDSEESQEDSISLEAFFEGIQISPVRASRLVNIRFRSPNPKLSAEVANAHARQYIEQNLQLRFVASQDATDWLGARIKEEQARVEGAEMKLQRYREEHDAVALGEGQDIVVQKLSDLNVAVTKAKTRRLEAETRYRQLGAIRNDRAALDAYPAILGNAFIQQLKGEVAQLQRESAQLAETLGERHPRLIEKLSALSTSENRLSAEISRVVDSIQTEYQSAVAEEVGLVQALDAQKNEALALDRRGIEYGVLRREAESARHVYDALLIRAKETGVSRDLRASSIRIVDVAEAPGSPTTPRKVQNLLMGIFGGSILAIGLAFLFEYLDQRVKTPDDLRDIGVPFIGLLPRIPRAKRRGAVLITRTVTPTFLEALRGVRTTLIHYAVQTKGTHSIVVASTSRGDGKSVVASNLAVALAQAQKRVLLVDADMRDPSCHALFKTPRAPGLSNLLSGELPLESVIRQTSISGLELIAAGPVPDDPPQLLGSAFFKGLLEHAEGRFDWVIIDTPPVMAVADAAVLADKVIGVLFVVGADMTSRRGARLAIEQLVAGGAQVIGAVLNGVNLSRHPRYYSPYYRTEYPGMARPGITSGL